MPEKTIAAKSKYNQTISRIMLLSYVEKFKPNQDKFQEFWKKYHIYDVPAEIRKLISYGLVKESTDSYELTTDGQSEVKANEFVMYYHKTRVTYPPIMNVLWMNEQLKKYPKHRYRDLIWGEFNRLSAIAMERANSGSSNRQYIYYRKLMGEFLMEESNRYISAIEMVSECVYYSVNDIVSYIRAGMSPDEIRNYIFHDLCIPHFKSVVKKQSLNDNELFQLILDSFAHIMLHDKNIKNVDIAGLIVAETFSDADSADKIYRSLSR